MGEARYQLILASKAPGTDHAARYAAFVRPLNQASVPESLTAAPMPANKRHKA